MKYLTLQKLQSLEFELITSNCEILKQEIQAKINKLLASHSDNDIDKNIFEGKKSNRFCQKAIEIKGVE